MTSITDRSRNNVRAGIFVTAAMLLALGVIATLTDLADRLSRQPTYTVYFDVAEGVNNLKPGADVRVGGVPLGRVIAVQPHTAPDGAFGREIDVEFGLDERVALHHDAIVMVRGTLIGTDAWIEIVDLGGTQRADGAAGAAAGEGIGAAARVVKPGQRLAGRGGGALLDSVFGPEAATARQSIIDFTTFLGQLDDIYEVQVQPALNDLNQTTDHLSHIAGELRHQQWPHWVASVNRMFEWTGGATEQINHMLASGREALATANRVVEDGEPKVREVLDNAAVATADVRDAAADAKRLTARLNDETLDKVHALLDDGRRGVGDAIAVIEQIRTEFAGRAGDVETILGNARLASQQAKLALIEVRRNPWKLLYRPSNAEVEHELLYDAARSFALAAADLKDASRNMQRILDEHAEALHDNPDLLDRLRTGIGDRLDAYDTAQRRLLEIITVDGHPSGS